MAQKTNSIETVSKNLWRTSSLVVDGPATQPGLGSIANFRPETLNEAKFFIESPRPGPPFPMPPSPIAGIQPESIPDTAANPIAGALAASMQQSLAHLSDDFGRRYSQGQFTPLSSSIIEELQNQNPVAYDRLLSTSPEQHSKTLIAGQAQDSILLIPRKDSFPVDPGGSGEQANWEEIFSARRSANGPTTVSGLRNQNNEWYHFTSQIATPPHSFNNHPQGKPAPVASSSFAPKRLLQSKDPASLADLDGVRVRKDVQAITEGPWRPFLQGKTLKNSEHAVQGVHSSPKGIDAFKAAFDSVNGVLKNIQEAAKGIMKAAEILGVLGELGQFGDVLKWIGALNLPKSPADLINSLILGKGILPSDTPEASLGICNGSGEGGLVVTKNGQAAKDRGDQMIAQVAVLQKKGSGDNAKSAKDTNAEVNKKQTGTVPKKEQPTDTVPGDDHPAERHPANSSSENNKPADNTPANTNPAENDSAESNTNDSNPANSSPGENRPANSNPADSNSNPANSSSEDNKPADGNTANSNSAGSNPADSKPEGSDSGPTSTAPTAAPELTTYAQKGDVQVSRDGGKTWQSLPPGTNSVPLFRGDILRTGADSRVGLVNSRGELIRMGPHSAVEVGAKRDPNQPIIVGGGLRG